MATLDDIVVVLLHPFPVDGTFWAPMWRELDLPVQVVTPNFPGFGSNTYVPDHVSIVDVADDIAGLIAETGRRAVVCGLSLGGYIALSLVARHPDVVAGLLLANTRSEADTDEARRNREQAIDTIRIDGFDVWRNAFVPKLLRPHPAPHTLDFAWTLAAGQRPEAVISALLALRDRPDRTADLSAIAVPTVVVAGAEDQVAPRAAMDALASGIPGAQMRVISDAGHLTALEQPETFAEVLRELVERVSA